MYFWFTLHPKSRRITSTLNYFQEHGRKFLFNILGPDTLHNLDSFLIRLSESAATRDVSVVMPPSRSDVRLAGWLVGWLQGARGERISLPTIWTLARRGSILPLTIAPAIFCSFSLLAFKFSFPESCILNYSRYPRVLMCEEKKKYCFSRSSGDCRARSPDSETIKRATPFFVLS